MAKRKRLLPGKKLGEALEFMAAVRPVRHPNTAVAVSAGRRLGGR